MSRRTTNGTPCIDITDLKRRGQLVFGAKSSLAWTNNHGEQIAEVWIEVWRDFMNVYNPFPLDQLIQAAQAAGGKEYSAGNAKHTMVILSYSSTKMGAVTWALCPSCSKKCRKLYVWGTIKCQRCHGLVNYSSTQPPNQRKIDQAQAIYDRLVGNSKDGSAAFERAECPDRPPRMRKTTYAKLRDKYNRLMRQF